MTESGEAVRTEQLTKRFGARTALDHLDLVVERGTVFGYLGPNGAGKTTTIRLLAGLYRPTSGQSYVLGRDVAEDRDGVQARLGYLPSDFVGYPDLSGLRFLELLGSLRGGVPEVRMRELAERMDVDLGRRISTLSHGNRQKLGIIQAFMHEPELVILDEPTQGLDPLVQTEFLALVREYRDLGRTVLLSSHVLSEVEAVADEVGILADGRLIAVRTMDELRREAVSRVDLRFETPVPTSVLLGVHGVRDVEVDGLRAGLSISGSMAQLFTTLSSYGVADVHTHESDLAAAFLTYYQERGEARADDRPQGDVGATPQPSRLG